MSDNSQQEYLLLNYTIMNKINGDREYILQLKSKVKIYFIISIFLAITTVVFMVAWLEMISFVKSI